MTDLDPYHRALGSWLAHEADDIGTPRELFAVEPWWIPDPNPFPSFDPFPRWTAFWRRVYGLVSR